MRCWYKRCGALAIAAAAIVACTEAVPTRPPGAGGGIGDGGAGGAGGSAGGSAGGDVSPLTYPADPAPLEGAACTADQGDHWTYQAPAECAGKRTCVDQRQRFWVGGEPFFPRGVYNGGYEYEQLLSNCPANAACEATTPSDAAGYVGMLSGAGFNLIMDRSRFLAQVLLDAIHDDAAMKIAHLLWSDPFSQQGHDDMVAEIVAAAADGDVVMWFGPDEIDLWDNWSEAAGIRRLLRGSSPELDALLNGKYAPGGTPYLPVTEPANDPHGLPFGAALAYDPGLAAGTDVYDMLLPVTYPFEEPYSLANAGVWGTWRISHFGQEGVPVVPVLQMVGIPSMGLSQPTEGQIRGQIMSALVHGARGAFYYNLIGDQPEFAGRSGWFAADQAETWQAYTEQHALIDSLLRVLHSESIEESGVLDHLEWRRWSLADRQLVVIANPTPYERRLDLDEIIELPADRFVRSYDGCVPFTERELALPAYGALALEVYP